MAKRWKSDGERPETSPASNRVVHRRGRRAKGNRRWQRQPEYASIFLKVKSGFSVAEERAPASVHIWRGKFSGGARSLRGKLQRACCGAGESRLLLGRRYPAYPLVAATTVVGARNKPRLQWGFRKETGTHEQNLEAQSDMALASQSR